MILLPTFQTQSADFSYRINLNRQQLRIRITYNTRSGAFFLLVSDQAGNQLGRAKCSLNYPLFRSHKAIAQFQGDFMIVQEDAALPPEITYDTFGNGHNFYYLTPDEVTAWEQSNGL